MKLGVISRQIKIFFEDMTHVYTSFCTEHAE